jgi:hypothetical protein
MYLAKAGRRQKNRKRGLRFKAKLRARNRRRRKGLQR